MVIIGILAALILPRLLQQPERARVAEAMQMLGVIKRAQINTRDSGGTNAWLALTAPTGTAAEWQALGLQQPPAGLFNYTCTIAGNGTCTATSTRVATDTIQIDLTTNAWTCNGAYRPAVAPGSGCTA